MEAKVVQALKPLEDIAISLVSNHLHLETEKGSIILTLDKSQVAQLTNELPDVGGRRQGLVPTLDSENLFPPNYSKAARPVGGYEGSLQAFPVSITYRGGESLTMENAEGFVTLALNDRQRSQIQTELPDLY